MRPVYIWLWCCVLLLASIGGSAFAAISDEGKQAIERLRQKNMSAEAEPARPGFRDLAEQLRKKHSQASAEKPDTRPVTAPGKETVRAIPTTAEAEFPVVSAETQAAENPATAETADSGCRGADELTVEKYDHLPYPAAPLHKTPAAKAHQSTSQQESDGGGFKAFIAAIFTIMVLFQFGSAMASSGDSGSASGGVQALGALMLVAGLIVGAATMIKFWPILLLLFFCSMFSQSKSGSDSCGCGCGIVLLILALMIF